MPTAVHTVHKEIDTLARLAENILAARYLMQSHLPLENSFLTFDLILIVMAYSNREVGLSIKAVYTRLDYAESRMRIVVRRLEREGWIEVVADQIDKRSKRIRPTTRLCDVFRLLEGQYGSKVMGCPGLKSDFSVSVPSSRTPFARV